MTPIDEHGFRTHVNGAVSSFTNEHRNESTTIPYIKHYFTKHLVSKITLILKMYKPFFRQLHGFWAGSSMSPTSLETFPGGAHRLAGDFGREAAIVAANLRTREGESPRPFSNQHLGLGCSPRPVQTDAGWVEPRHPSRPHSLLPSPIGAGCSSRSNPQSTSTHPTTLKASVYLAALPNTLRILTKSIRLVLPSEIDI